MPAWGNHEYETPDSDDFRNYKGRHDLPNPQTSPNAPSLGCCGEDWYWFDYGNVRFIAYPEPYPGAVNEWATHAGPLMDVAQVDPAIDFIVTFGHRPAFSSGNHPGESTLRNALAALAVGHPKYVLNLNGHSHDYERSYPQVGVTHVTAGTGGASLENTGIPACDWVGGCPAPPWSAYRAMHHVILKLHFTATTIEGTAYCGPAEITRDDMVCQEGTILDTFTIQPTLGLGPAGAPSPPAARAWVWPTVVQSSGTLSFVSTRDGPATVELFDLAGRRVAEVMDARALKSGRHDVTIGDPYRNTGQLPGGMYLYRVRLGEGVLRGRFLIAR